jgi:hypothetical protein
MSSNKKIYTWYMGTYLGIAVSDTQRGTYRLNVVGVLILSKVSNIVAENSEGFEECPVWCMSKTIHHLKNGCGSLIVF